MRASFDTLSLSLPSTTDTGCCLCVLPRFHPRFISIRWRSAYCHSIILLPITNMISTLVPMDITLSIDPAHSRPSLPLCIHFQPYLFHLTGTNYLYLPCTIVRSMINHPHSSCNSVFYSTATVHSSRRARSYYFFEHSTCILSLRVSFVPTSLSHNGRGLPFVWVFIIA